MRLVATAILLAALAASRLDAQGDVQARLAGRVPAAVAVAVQDAAAQASAQGLPIEPLVQKALEGAAKGVPPERVIAAIRELAARLATAAGALREGGVDAPDAETIEAGAFALTAGLSADHVRDLARASVPPYTPAATLRIAATLAAIGVPPAQVVELLVANITAGRSVTELASLPGAVQSQMARGATPAQAARGLTRAAAGGRPAAPGRPADKPGQRPSRP